MLFLPSRRRSLDKLRQRLADRCERIGVVRIRWLSVPFEMRPIAECPSPFRIGLTHKIRQLRFRFEDLVEVSDQDDPWLIEILEQDLASPHLTEHHLRQYPARVIEVRS